jgi:hypothetical protein
MLVTIASTQVLAFERTKTLKPEHIVFINELLSRVAGMPTAVHRPCRPRPTVMALNLLCSAVARRSGDRREGHADRPDFPTLTTSLLLAASGQAVGIYAEDEANADEVDLVVEAADDGGAR